MDELTNNYMDDFPIHPFQVQNCKTHQQTPQTDDYTMVRNYTFHTLLNMVYLPYTPPRKQFYNTVF